MPSPLVTAVEGDEVVFRLDDPRADRGGRVDGVRLWSDFDLGDAAFSRSTGAYDGWELRVPVAKLPPVDRLEYLFEVARGGSDTSMLDPGNPRRVGGSFGDHSVLELAGYRPPAWLDAEPTRGTREPLVVTGTPVGTVDVEIWSPSSADPEAALPLLLNHDGPEMDQLGELTRFVGATVEAGSLPPMRVGLLAPGPGTRDERYAASPAYAKALCDVVLPALLEQAPSRHQPVLMGQSLGALAALHAEWTHPGTFGGLLLQSGSFFTPELDPQESGYTSWQPVTEFVAEVLGADRAPSRASVGVCWGTAEENAANNRQLAEQLARLGLDVTTGEVRDGHTFTCWRDLLDPHLTDVLTNAWRL